MSAADRVRLERLDPIPIAVVQRQAPPSQWPRVVPDCCGLVWNLLRAQGVRGGRHVAIYHGGDRLDVGVETDAPFTERDGLVKSATPAGAVAVATHLGPYEGLRQAHDAIHAWAEGAGHRLAGPRWEIYGHWQSEWDADPSRIRTDVHYLLMA